LPAAKFGYMDDKAFLRLEGKAAGLQARKAAYGNADAFGLREMAQYGLKGTMAYFAHAERIYQQNPNAYSSVDRENTFSRLYDKLEALAMPSSDINSLVGLNLDIGALNLKIMELLDTAHNETFGRTTPTTVSTIPAEGKCILVSGHDMVDIYELLKQTEGTGINIYTHGEMLPAHGYPHIRAFPHLKGHYGTAWQNQKIQFSKFPGPILMTSNCIVEPRSAYRDRIFTTNSVGVHGIKHISSHDFSEVIKCALEQPGFTEKHTKAKSSTADTLTVGFGHRTIEGVADKVLDAIKKKQIGNIFVIGGCDGNEMERSYFTQVGEKLPDDAMVLTMGCGKFRINHLDLGTVGGQPGGIPRMLDVGQCNDAYSAVKVALLLANALNTGVNDLPLNLCISWFEQKAVAVLLTLLHLNIQRIRLGPNLPAFITPNMLNMLAEAYKIRAADADKVDDDLKRMFAHN
jgi:hydroxylamine reductase